MKGLIRQCLTASGLATALAAGLGLPAMRQARPRPPSRPATAQPAKPLFGRASIAAAKEILHAEETSRGDFFWSRQWPPCAEFSSIRARTHA